jgi:hypothetical protein
MQRFGVILIITISVMAMAVVGGYQGGSNAPDGNGGNAVQSCTFTVDTTAGGAVAVNNSTLPGRTTFLFGAGTVVGLKAVPDSGYQLVRWSGDVGGVDDVYASEILVTVNGNYSIVARFEVIQPVRYTLAILSTPGGSVTAPGKGTYVYEEGTVVSLVVTPTSGYEFAGWTGNVDTIADVKATSTTITMNGDCYICANFREHRTCGIAH